jgi:hypothetical protein
MESEFTEMMNQTLTVEPFVSADSHNDYTWDEESPETCSARIQESNKFIRDKTGVQVLSTVQIYPDGSITIGVLDRITLPDGTQPEIIKVANEVDEYGNLHHQVVFTK